MHLNSRKVCVTGIGMITPLGNGREATWQSVVAGRCAGDRITSFDANGWPVQIACEVKNFALPDAAILPHQKKILNRPSEFGMSAVWEAMSHAGISQISQPTRLSVIAGTGIGAIRPREVLKMLRHYKVDQELSAMAAYLAAHDDEPDLSLRNHPATLAALIAERWNAQGQVSTISTACAAGAQALGHGMQLIRANEADLVIAGGADSLAGELLLAGFCLLGVLSQRNESPQTASRPFDKTRDGFVASEGAAFLVLEEYEHARARGAPILCELVGYGESENAYRITDLPQDGHGATAAMRAALTDASLTPAHINYINAHGTSTEQNDRIECRAIEDVFYATGAHPQVSSTKSVHGHLVAAAGALEAALSVLALRDQKIPPSINLQESNCGDSLRFATQANTSSPLGYTLSNSFGFGGTNASLIFGRCAP